MSEPLRSQLEKLHRDLADTRMENPVTRTIADALRNSVANVLEVPEIDPDRHARSLYRELKDALLHFEAAHPNLTASVENVIDTLVRLGV